MGLHLCPHMEGWRKGLKPMDLLYTEFPPYKFSDWPSYFTLRAPNWIHKGFGASCYNFQLKNSSSKLLLCHDLTLQRHLPNTQIFLPVNYFTFFPLDMCVQLDLTLDKYCPFCIMLILWSQMNKISLIRLMNKALHKMQSVIAKGRRKEIL